MGEPYSDAAEKWHAASYRKERAVKNKKQPELVYGTAFDDGFPFRSPQAVNRTETNDFLFEIKDSVRGNLNIVIIKN